LMKMAREEAGHAVHSFFEHAGVRAFMALARKQQVTHTKNVPNTHPRLNTVTPRKKCQLKGKMREKVPMLLPSVDDVKPRRHQKKERLQESRTNVRSREAAKRTKTPFSTKISAWTAVAFYSMAVWQRHTLSHADGPQAAFATAATLLTNPIVKPTAQPSERTQNKLCSSPKRQCSLPPRTLEVMSTDEYFVFEVECDNRKTSEGQK
jgi:hypothetical protein